MRSASWPIAVRIAISGAVGTLASVFAFYCNLMGSIECYIVGVNCRIDPHLHTSNVLRAVLEALSVTVIALVPVSPLIAVAIAAGLIFRRSIERHLLLWSLSAPVAVWLFVCLVFASMPGGGSIETRAFPERLWACVTAIDNLLFLFGPMVSGLALYGMSVTRRAHPSGRAAGSGDQTPAA